MSKAKRIPGVEVRETRRGTVFLATVYDKRARRKLSRTHRTITAAKQWRSRAMAQLEAGQLSADRGPTLNEAIDQWLDSARAGHVKNRSGDPYKPAAIRGYEQNARKRLLPDLGNHRLGDIRTKDVQALVDRLVASGIAPATVMTSLNPLRAVYRRAESRGVVHHNPTRGIEMPAIRSGEKRIASPAEARRLLAALPVEDRPLWACALYSGLRRGELTALLWGDVDLAAGTIYVQRGWDIVEGEIAPKSRQGRRRVPVAAALRDYLVEHRMRDGGEPTARVFGTPHAVRRLAERAKRIWEDDADLTPITFHECRHTFASLMIAAGVNAKTIQTLMGHANIAVTFDLYGHLMPGSEAEAADRLDSFLAADAVRAADGSTSTETSTDPAMVPA